MIFTDHSVRLQTKPSLLVDLGLLTLSFDPDVELVPLSVCNGKWVLFPVAQHASAI